MLDFSGFYKMLIIFYMKSYITSGIMLTLLELLIRFLSPNIILILVATNIVESIIQGFHQNNNR